MLKLHIIWHGPHQYETLEKKMYLALDNVEFFRVSPNLLKHYFWRVKLVMQKPYREKLLQVLLLREYNVKSNITN